MSAKLDGDDVNSGCAVREEIKEESGGSAEGSECKTVMDNTSYPGQVGRGILNDDGNGALEESKVLVGEEQSEGVNSKTELGEGTLGRGLKLTGKFEKPRLRAMEMMSRDDGGGSVGVMNLVGKVLGGNFSKGNDGEDLQDSEDSADIDIVAHCNESENESGINNDVNNVNADELIPKEYEDACMTENEGEYDVSDLVWGKVKNHPWWPGQIYAPSAASHKAKIHFKKDSYLIAYFGDLTFAWNKASKIRPFRGHFFLMDKQSKAEGFRHAVDCALDEVARRAELGLSCSCLPKEVHDKIKSQVVENAGIREESSIRNGGDSISIALLFFPEDLLQFIRYFAEAPCSETDKLHFVIIKAQLLAFNRWKGLYQLPKLEQYYLLLEDDAQFNVEQGGSRDFQGVSEGVFSNSEDAIIVPSKERKSTTQHFSSRNPKRLSSDSTVATSLGELATSNVRKSRRKQIASADFSPDEILSKLSLAATNPMQGGYILTSIIGLLCQIRNSMRLEKSSVRNESRHAGKQPISWEITDVPGFDGTKDSYDTQEHVVFEPKNPTVAAAELEAGSGTENPCIQTNEIPEECLPTALILFFKDLESIPSIADLHEICKLYGPLNELKTELFSKSKLAKVVFKRKVDAESISSRIEEYSLFGPSLVSFRLHVLPSKSRATSKPKRKIHP